MRSSVLLVSVLFIAPSVCSQEKHEKDWTPPHQACVESISELTNKTQAIQDMTAGYIEDALFFLDSCTKAYPNEMKPNATSLTEVYSGAYTTRLKRFLIRHDLMGQFHREDKAGMR